ncbi:hypothetical protein H072_6158 [Dactylellina haptotyla CBS 200.50]|uniref:Uncharacterized protein n=1 Tax=Dactylellina haptotyla (strain CBS 200.50) TaxID=1284197 RepID=S8AFV7_DACHA|nr:hypothetical protein H072_6158 [Dactylellina haptotyla CBS 200.50]
MEDTKTSPPLAPLDTDTYDYLSDISSTFSPTSNIGSDTFLNSPLPPTLSNTFLFPRPSSGISIGSTSPSSAGFSENEHISHTINCPEKKIEYEWTRCDRSISDRSANIQHAMFETLSDTSAYRNIKPRLHHAYLKNKLHPQPCIRDTNTTETVISSSVDFLLSPSTIPGKPTEIVDLFLGSCFTAALLRLNIHIASAVLGLPSGVLSAQFLIFLVIFCVTSLLAWFASAGREMRKGWAAWCLGVSLRFMVLTGGMVIAGAVTYVSFLLAISAFKSAGVSEPGEVDDITITLPSDTQPRHVLDIVARLQSHLVQRIGVIERDMISFVNGSDERQRNEKMTHALEKIYAGLSALGEVDAGVLVEVLGGLWRT